MEVLKSRLAEQEAKARFIKEALEDFDLLKQSEDDLFEYFDAEGYWKKMTKDHDEEDTSCYSYLTSMPVRTFTTDHYQKLLKSIEDIKSEIQYVKKKTPKQMWSVELDEFEKAYVKWKKEIEAVHTKLAKKKIKRYGKGKKENK